MKPRAHCLRQQCVSALLQPFHLFYSHFRTVSGVGLVSGGPADFLTHLLSDKSLDFLSCAVIQWQGQADKSHTHCTAHDPHCDSGKWGGFEYWVTMWCKCGAPSLWILNVSEMCGLWEFCFLITLSVHTGVSMHATQRLPSEARTCCAPNWGWAGRQDILPVSVQQFHFLYKNSKIYEIFLWLIHEGWELLGMLWRCRDTNGVGMG